MRFKWALIAAAIFAVLTPQTLSAKARLEPLTVRTASKAVHFKVEVVSTPEGRERGLMFRKSLPADQGMLFDFHSERPVAFWMKNTLMPLDIIFVSADGRVVSIARNAVPMSETPLPSGLPALGVLEINGGQAAALHIEPGDQIAHRIFSRK
jgi:uncharacterized membrane protein (UPF0127 family)